ncbi:hypothetical protein [Actinoallomurus iriomotensis]|uniref:Lipoprotein n=1 Tax=Actinoallomurus iriomotensis TaxID=478107 RepID=A0A9W6RR32_9ACTN|nr:hypothetical protein [Actinoallomurus iriomotensis]GLY78612.1 hypothetical protein Airi01_068790 [Actinoallomurus iriomotensis]
MTGNRGRPSSLSALVPAVSVLLAAGACQDGHAPERAHYVLAVRSSGGAVCGDGVARLLTAAGRQVALVRRPAGICDWSTVTAGVSPGRPSRIFFLRGLTTDRAHMRLYRIRVDEHGKIVELAPVPGMTSADDAVDAIAVTPDGTRFAFPTSRPGKGGMAYGVVVTGATGRPRTTLWADRGWSEIVGLSWAANGRTLRLAQRAGPGIRVVDTGTAHDLARDSRLVVPATGWYGDVDAEAGTLSGDGTQTYFITHDHSHPPRAVDRVIAAPVSGGGAARVLFERHYEAAEVPGKPPTPANLLGDAICREGDGAHLLVAGGDRSFRITIATHAVETLPLSFTGTQEELAC